MSNESGKWAEKQLSQEQAIAFYDSKQWEQMTDEQIVRFQLFQQKLAVPFDRFHKAMGEVLGRAVYTHEFGGSGRDSLVLEYLGEKATPTLEEIIDLIPAEKRVILNF